MDRRPRRPEFLQTAFWNAHGLKPRVEELKEFVQRHQLDAILVNETHLRASDRLSIPNFRGYRNDRLNAAGGGTAIFVKNTIEHHLNVIADLHQMEATSVTIRTTTGPLTLISAYNHTGRRILDHDLVQIFNTRGAVILAGDLNSKHPSWNSRTTNAAGRSLRRFADNLNLVVEGPLEPTSCPYNDVRPDVLDIIVMRDVTMTHRLTNLCELSSDHNPVLLQLGEPNRVPEDPPVRKIVSWPAFTEHLARTLGPITMIDNADQLEGSVSTLTDRVIDSIDYATNVLPVQEPRSVIPREIKDLIRDKNRLRRRWQRSLDPAHKAEYNRLSEQVKTALEEFRSSRWNDVIERSEESQAAFWKTVKMLKNRPTPMPPIHGPRGMAFTIEEKAEVFAESVETQCSPNYEDADVDHIASIHRSVRRILLEEDHENPITPTSPEEVRKVLRSCKPNKAPGPDGIPSRALKHLPKKAIVALTNIVNTMFRLHHFPSQWKCADVIVLKKPGQRSTEPTDYRPISLLPALGKTAERILLSRLNEDVERLNVIPNAQFGFRPRHDTTLQILRLVEHVKEGFNLHEYTGAVFLDVSKAFDKVWHEGLLYKMHGAGISSAMLRLIRSFLHNRTFRIKLEHHRSTVRMMTAGVPQGSALSPVLFNIFARDFPTTPNTRLALYADDVCAYTRSMNAKFAERRLQRALDSMETWYRTRRINIHPEKSTAILFSRSGCRKRRHGDPEDLRIFGGAIPWRTQVKYLGVIMDARLTWGQHVESVVLRARQMQGSFYALINRRSKLDPACKIKLYKTVMRPTMTYASPVWATAADCHMRRLQVFQNKALRMAFDAPWFVRNATLHQDAGMETIRDHIRRLAEKTFERADDHRNPPVGESAVYDPGIPWQYSRPRMIVN